MEVDDCPEQDGDYTLIDKLVPEFFKIFKKSYPIALRARKMRMCDRRTPPTQSAGVCGQAFVGVFCVWNAVFPFFWMAEHLVVSNMVIFPVSRRKIKKICSRDFFCLPIP